jgi:hypothetical protein
MEFQFYFGPDKIPFRLLDNGMVESASTMPFHGIISRGMLHKFLEHNLSSNHWHACAFHLEYHDPQFCLTEDFRKFQQYFRECDCLSFAQSAFCAQQYTVAYATQRGVRQARVELWNIKEGHTSSVWKATITSEDQIETFVLNVARDRDAGLELKKTSEVLQKIASSFPDADVAMVYDIYTYTHPSLPGAVIITRNEWVDNSYEIHQRKNKQNGRLEFLLVDRFLTAENNSALITAVLGRAFSEDETQKIKSGLDDLISKASTCLSRTPTININDGDLVWDGKKAIAVALS